MENYFIKEGYTNNLNPNGQVVEQYTEIPHNNTYQIAAYKTAAGIIKTNKLESCIELGSGSGYKLHKYISPLVNRAVGIDMPHSVEYCQKKYPDIEWISDDFDNPVNTINDKFDIAISFDVVEHLVYPEKLLYKLKSYVKPGGTIMISTPERDLMWGKEHMGPTINKKHVREWNKNEFLKLLEHYGLNVQQHIILADQEFSLKDRLYALIHGNKAVVSQTCQLAVCQKMG